jgi:hypothetical protein
VRGYGKEVREKLKEAGWASSVTAKAIMTCGTAHEQGRELRFQ